MSFFPFLHCHMVGMMHFKETPQNHPKTSFCVSLTDRWVSRIEKYIFFLPAKTGFFQKCEPLTLAAFAVGLRRYSFTTSKLLKNVHPKLSKASCGMIQVFCLVSWAQYFQNTLISDKKPPNPSHPVQGSLSRARLSEQDELDLETF